MTTSALIDSFIFTDVKRTYANTQLSSAEKPVRPHVSDGQGDVRRPLGDFRVLPDTYATLSVRRRGGALVQLKNTSADKGVSTYTANMLIQNVSISVTEKMQLTQTFDNDRLFFFGKNLDTLNVRAILIENESFQWYQEWYANYVSATSGTASAERGAEAVLRIEEYQYFGYITQFSCDEGSSDRHALNLSFMFTVVRSVDLRELRASYPILQNVADVASAGAQITRALQSAQIGAQASRAFGDIKLSAVLKRASQNFLLPVTAKYKPAPMRTAFPDEYPNSAEGYEIDALEDAKITKAITTAVRSIPVTAALTGSSTETVASLLRRAELSSSEEVRSALDAKADALANKIVNDYRLSVMRRPTSRERTYDRYTGLYPAAMPPAVFQARQVGLGFASIALSAVSTTVVSAFTDPTPTSFKDALLTRAGLSEEPSNTDMTFGS
jgi:hypothetical protein